MACNGDCQYARELRNLKSARELTAPATCSEVVERLEKLLVGTDTRRAADIAKFREQSTAILHSWRERRVQELKEALREIIAESDQSNGGKGAKLPIVLYMKELAEKALKGGGSHGE